MDSTSTPLITPPSPSGYLSPTFTFFPLPSSSSNSNNKTTTPTLEEINNKTKLTKKRSTSITSSSSTTSSSSLSSSSISTSSSYDSILQDQLQWEESIHQLNQIFNLVALPYFAKWAGRKWAYFMFGRYLNLGLNSRSFWIGETLDTLLRRNT